MEGIKYDEGKPRWSLLPWREMEEVVRVLGKGSEKYADFNWQKVPNPKDRYFSALQRHIIAWWNGEQNDKDDNLHHLAHAICCALFLFWFDNKESNEDSKACMSHDDIGRILKGG